MSKYTLGRERSSRCRGDRLDEWKIGIILNLLPKTAWDALKIAKPIPRGALRGEFRTCERG
jgi:hypothetical protein